MKNQTDMPDMFEKIFPPDLCGKILDGRAKKDNITEIKLRAGFPARIRFSDGNTVFRKDALSQRETEKVFMYMCGYTVSAYEKRLSRGFISPVRGVRVGVGGKYHGPPGRYRLPAKVFSLTVRLPSFVYTAAPEEILNFKKGEIIAGPPHSGKTTLLRAVCRSLQRENVAVCDEREEIYSPELDCDFLLGIEKPRAIEQAVRTLNPDIVICDEIGSLNEAEKILSFVNSGVRFIITVHRASTAELYKKPNISLLLECGAFDRIVVLSERRQGFGIKEIRDV